MPEDPRARHCSRSRSTGSEHAESCRLALMAISRSCLDVPAITKAQRFNINNDNNNLEQFIALLYFILYNAFQDTQSV